MKSNISSLYIPEMSTFNKIYRFSFFEIIGYLWINVVYVKSGKKFTLYILYKYTF